MAELSKSEVSALYVALFGRASENEGNEYWQTQGDLSSVADAMLQTQAAQDYFGDNLNDNSAFIAFIYENTLNKTLADDPDGIAYWTNLLDSGISKGEVVANLIGAIDTYAPGAQNYDPNDTATVAAYNQFENRVNVSNYTADKLLFVPEDYATALSFNDDLVVTDDVGSVGQMKDALDLKYQLPKIVPTQTTVDGTAQDDYLIGTGDNDALYGNEGNDILRGGNGLDLLDGGDGDDAFIIIGDLSKTTSDADVEALKEKLNIDTLEYIDYNEDEDGGVETIIGGAGNDTLYVIGSVDASNYNISGVENIEFITDLRVSDTLFEEDSELATIKGTPDATLAITGGDSTAPLTVDLANSTIDFQDIGQLDLDTYVTIVTDSLEKLGGANILTGDGTIQASAADVDLTLPEDFTVEQGITVTNSDRSEDLTGDAQVLTSVITANGLPELFGTDGDDYLVGTDNAEIFYTKAGDDTLTGFKGDDTYVINGTGTKIIIDSDEANSGQGDTIDLSTLTEGASVNLKTGGTVGNDTIIEIGALNAQGATGKTALKSNITIVLDSSGSMYGSNMDNAKAAALALLDAYEQVGETAVRLVDFDNYATSSFNGNDSWMSVSDAKSIINDYYSFYPDGGTNYASALSEAETAFLSGQETNYIEGANNHIFFLSDGEPNYGYEITPSQQQSWEDFLIENQIKADAIGFGGIYNSYYLNPIAFDGTAVVDSNGDGIINAADDHTAGEIEPTVETNINALVDQLVSTAALDFIESLVGTNYDDKLTGNDLDNFIYGNGGADILDGSKGNDTLDFGSAGDADTYANYNIANNGSDTLINFVSGEDTIQLLSSDLNGLIGFDNYIAGNSVNFVTFDANSDAKASYLYGTFIYDSSNKTLIFDPSGDTSFDGVSNTRFDPSGNDIVLVALQDGEITQNDIVLL